jgi:FlaA1/EpsC-like NDP-sugar epimerase
MAALASLPRREKRLVLLAMDALCLPLVMWAAMALRDESWHPTAAVWPMVAAVGVSVPLFTRLGLYRAVTRYIGPHAARAVVCGVLLSLLALGALVGAGLLPSVRPTTLVNYGLMVLVYAGASRMLLRWVLYVHLLPGAPVVIYGAGTAGIGLAAALTAARQFRPVAFVDDSDALVGAVISGIKVHSPAALPGILQRSGARRVLLAMPALGPKRRREILESIAPYGAHVLTIPNVGDLVTGNARLDDVQEVDAADLLGREPVPPNQRLLDGCVRAKCVLVTGAGGSIGSELCRQILRLAPSRLLLLEMSELALYNVERELRAIREHEGLCTEIVPLLGNAHHKYRVREILQTFGVDTIYHAAAYKHVPIVEHNVIEGLHNNVFSTWYTAEAALECRVSTFVLISTDKAVNPTNVMGATKRFAEIVLQGLQQRSSATRFCMVRFGNVLESSGSVVPLFREQIRRGGPVTVTHPDVIRYFMTIPEAAQLVIQAGSMAAGGDVFVLDMGRPLKIADLARRMVQLYGLTVRDDDHPDGDIEIRFTGLRPAEKLFEELLIGKNITTTDHPMIMRAVEHALPWDQVHKLLEELSVVMRRFDCAAARQVLESAVREYRASPEIHDLVWSRRSVAPVAAAAALESKITDLGSRRSRVPSN